MASPAPTHFAGVRRARQISQDSDAGGVCCWLGARPSCRNLVDERRIVIAAAAPVNARQDTGHMRRRSSAAGRSSSGPCGGSSPAP